MAAGTMLFVINKQVRAGPLIVSVRTKSENILLEKPRRVRLTFFLPKTKKKKKRAEMSSPTSSPAPHFYSNSPPIVPEFNRLRFDDRLASGVKKIFFSCYDEELDIYLFLRFTEPTEAKVGSEGLKEYWKLLYNIISCFVLLFQYDELSLHGNWKHLFVGTLCRKASRGGRGLATFSLDQRHQRPIFVFKEIKELRCSRRRCGLILKNGLLICEIKRSTATLKLQLKYASTATRGDTVWYQNPVRQTSL